MTDKEQAIADTISKALPLMTEVEKERVAGFAEGMLYMMRRSRAQGRAAARLGGEHDEKK